MDCQVPSHRASVKQQWSGWKTRESMSCSTGLQFYLLVLCNEKIHIHITMSRTYRITIITWLTSWLTLQIARCCSGFYGSSCQPCPGGFRSPCLDRGKVTSIPLKPQDFSLQWKMKAFMLTYSVSMSICFYYVFIVCLSICFFYFTLLYYNIHSFIHSYSFNKGLTYRKPYNDKRAHVTLLRHKM